MLDPFTQTKFLPEYKLILWRPSGILDFEKASAIVEVTGFQERVLDEPFNRFIDGSKLTDVRLNFREVADFALSRRLDYNGGPPVKSALFATNPVGFGIARMFATLMEPSPIDARAFRQIELAAAWLQVPVKLLEEE